MRVKLLPCPCCGAEAEYGETYLDQQDLQETLVIECSQCPLEMKDSYRFCGSQEDKEQTYKELAIKWNTRIE